MDIFTPPSNPLNNPLIPVQDDPLGLKSLNLSSGLSSIPQIPSATGQFTFTDKTLTQYLHQEVLPITQIALENFANSPNLYNNIELAFGYGCNVELAHTIVDNLAQGQLIPDIQIIPQSQLQADGAFGNNTIYLSQDLFNPQQTNSSQAVNVLLEEIGHYIDNQINLIDAPGDEGAIFAHLAQNQQLTPTELTALKSENDHSTLTSEGQTFAVEHADTPGVFLVDNNGEITIDFLADSGSYHNEMAIFSLQNMDNLTPGSVDYIKEASRRALSNSVLGYTVIIDINEGAKFAGELGETNKNDGNYSGLKTFNFTPGDKIAFMLVPEGTVKQVFDNPSSGNSQRPLFSIDAANPNNAIQIGQLLPGTFGWEDIRNDQNTDADYNDIIFKITGATGTLTDIGGLFASGKDWRNLPLAQEIIAFASSITLTAKLSQDTGSSNLDGITNNPEISGSISNAENLSKFQAKFSDGSNFMDILSELKANGNFTLNKDKLAAIKGNQLADGEYQLTLRGEDKSGNIVESLVKFTLDTTKPGIPTEIGLKNDSDTVTNQNTPTVTGKGETGALIEIFDGQNKLGQTTVVNGSWEITTSQITDGLKNLTITATDVAGNISDAGTKEFTIDSALPQINITSPQANAILNSGARLQGTVNGTGSTIDKLTYRFGNGSEINVPVNAQGAFDVELNLTGVTGQQNLIIKAIDLAGNSQENTQIVIISQLTPDTTAPLVTAILNNDTGINTDSITSDSTIKGTVTNASEITKFQAKLNSGNFVDVLSKLQNGIFTLDKDTLTVINGGQLPDGNYQITLKAEDKFGNVSNEVKLDFTLDTTKPAVATELKIKDDTDTVTKDNTPIINGQAEAGTKVQIFDGQTKLGETISENGIWEITTSQLTDGVKNLTVITTDIAGNVSDNASLSITVDTVVPDLNITSPQANATLNSGARLQGTVNGTGSTIDKLTYRFGNGSEINVPVNAQGAFDVELDLTGVTGQQNLIIKAIDLAGNSQENTQIVIISQLTPDTTAPLVTAILNNDTGINTDSITSDSTIKGTVTDASEITKFQAKLNSGNFVDVLSKLQNGIFTLDKNTLTVINGGQLPDGNYQITLKAEDKFGNVSSEVKLDFTLDITAPQTPGFMLDTILDSAPIGDSQTTFTNVKLIGQTEANASVTLQQTGISITADNVGKFTFTDVPLILGDNSFTVNAKDIAGNTSTFTTIIKRVAQDNSDVVLDWNAVLLNAIYEDKTTPPVASRNMAITQTAVFDAINTITGTYKNYHFTGTAPTIVSAEAAAASAAHQVLINLYPGQKSYFDNALTASLAEITDGTAEDNGVTFGRTVADAILTFRSTDGSSNTITYTPGTNPGQWQPTAPGFASALLPQWGQVTPFALTSGDQFRPDGTPALNSADYTTEFNQVKDLGSKNSTTRTAEQTQIAKFWADGAGTFTPPGHWNQIAQNVAATKGNSLVENARLFALLDISLADAGIAAWDAKYTYNFWRPITAIQNADSDGNANTIADATWTPLLTTPPFPEYISGHSTFSGAAETILTGLLGNNVSFTTNSLGTPGIYRTFSNFTNAANEAGISRIYGGIHFNSANVEGLATGRSVGNYVLDNLLLPITEPVEQLTVMPGQQLKLESKDIFGKNANFALESGQNLPTGNLDSDGTLIFKPSPAQIGSYDFTLVARDGTEITTKKFNLAVVADTETTTRISGVIQNTDQKALAGVKVKIGDISTTTNADGSFILTVPPQGKALIIEPGQQVNNVVYPSIAEPLHLLLGHDVYANVKNIIDRPIYLPPIDISNAQTIDPTITQTVTSAAIPGSAVTVFANSLFDQQNQPYTGQLSITTVPTELTPAALPENLRPDLVVTIQPGEMVFTNPAPLSLPNLAGYAPGTQMDLWSINPQTGLFDNVGTGQVSADGKVINTISGGIRNSSWHFFAPPPPTPNDPDADDRNPDDGCDECKAKVPGTSEVELHSGAVIETHDLVPYQSLGINRGISLRYDSERADARPILHFGYNNVPNDSALRLMAELTIKRGDFKLEVPGFAGGQFGLNGGENFWSIPNGGGKIDAALQADLRTLDSGRYDYDLTTGLMRLNNNQLNGSTSTSKGKFLHINTVNSAFGSGWGLAGLQEIVVNADQSVIIIDGDGSELLFEKKADNSYKSPVGDFSTLERLNDGTFRRTMTDKTVYSFNGENLLTKMRDRVGNETQYVYENRRLMKMVDPVGLETTFTYSNNRIIEIKDPAGRSTKLTYDTNGNLIKITDPDGTSRTWEYNADHLMISEVDKRGNKEQTFYDFAGRADKAIRKDGSQLDFDPVQVQGLYAPNKTIDPVNAPPAFQLGKAASTYTDANGKKIVNNLDQSGQIVSSSDEVGLLPAVQRNEDNLVTRQTDARGNITSFTYDDNGNVLSIQDSLSFNTPNAGGNVLIVNGASGSSEPGTTSDSTNNIRTLLQEAGFQTTVVDSLPTDLTAFSEIWDIRFTNSQPITTTESAQYLSFLQSGGELFAIGENSGFSNRNNSLISFINQAGGGLLNFTVPNSTQQISGIFTTPNTIPDGNVTYARPGGVAGSGNGQFITFDGSGNSSAVIFDEGDLANALTGKLVAVFDINFFQGIYDQPDSQNLLKNIVQLNSTSRRFTYDPTFNQLTSMTDELGHQTLYQIDPNNGNLLSLTQVVGAVGGNDDLITQFTYTNNGLVDLITDPLGRITDSDYDANGRLISIIYAKGTADEAKRQFEYDLAGNQTAIINEKGDRTTFEYNALNRLVKTIEADPDGNGPLTSPITTYSYDADGNLISTTDAVGNVNQNTYDKLNRLVENIDTLNQKTSYSYDSLGNLLSVVDPLGNETENKYDARNRLIETIDPDSGITKFTYDLSNNLASVTDPVNNKTTFVYDARNRLISETDPLGKSTQYQYDPVNNLIAKTDRNNRRTEFKYDEINRLNQEKWVGTDQVINYSYDKVSNQTAVNDKFSSLAFNYDNRDRLLSVNNAGTPGFSNVVLNYSYDKVGNVLSVVDTINNVAGGNNSYSYDALNRLTKLTQSGNNVSDKRVDFAYNLLGQYTSINRYANLTGTQLVNGTTYTYDSLNRLTNLNHSNGTNNVAFYNYVYDAASRITKITDIDGTTDYTYDKRAQLTGANHSNANNPDESYSYDANGNRITSSIHGNGYVTGKGNRLLSDGKYNYEYDNEGNLTKQTEIATGKVQELTWDYRNRLVAMVDKDATGKETQRVEFTYDAFNRRIAKAVDTNPQDTTPPVVRQFIYDGQNVLLEFVDSDGAGANQPVLDTRYLHGAGVDQVMAQESAGNVEWHLTDHLGTIRDLVNNSGAVVNHFVYDSFGQVISESNPAIDTRYLFTGREFDSETGLYYYRARYYDQTTGRFLSEDPIGFNGGDSNLYRYVLNNPRNLTDPLGLLVNAVFNPSNGTLKIIDNDTGRTVIVENVFSGDNTHYPIPPGSYEILEHSHPHWFRLDPIDQYPRNDKDDKSGRFGFRLHPGTVSFGCITVPKNQSDDWDKVENLIRNTSTEKVNDNLGTLSWLRNLLGQKITKFGTIKVLK